MNPWQDGLSALTDHARAAVAILILMLWGFFIVRGLLARFFGDSISEAQALSIGAAGWVVPVLFLSLLAFATSLLFNGLAGGMLSVILILVSSFALIRKRFSRFTVFRGKDMLNAKYTKVAKEYLPLLVFATLLSASILLRFAFIDDLPLPLYFDSAEHYRLIDSLADSYRSGARVDALSGGFYHPGFHYISAGISYFLRVDIPDLMLAFGPLLLAVLPFSFFFIVERETGSTPAALFACLLAGFGFHMPAHLLDWGKYPALLSLACVMFVFDLAYMACRADLFKSRKPIFIFLALAIIASAAIHTRTLIVYGSMAIAAFVKIRWNRSRTPGGPIAGFLMLACLSAIEIYALYKNPALKTLLDAYLANDSWVLAPVLFLIVISAVHFAGSTFLLLAWLALCGFCLFIPIALPLLGVQTLLDRPFVQMLTYIPLSFLGGFGFAGTMRATRRFFPDLKSIQRFAPVFIFGFALLNAALRYDYYPSECCRLVGRDDLAAFSWMDETLPPDSKILIASAGLYVTSFESPQSRTGVDAGVWIPPLLSRRVELSGADTQFEQAEIHHSLCERGVDYIYVGAMPQSFNALRLNSRPGWYLQSFALPSAKIYKITGCGQQAQAKDLTPVSRSVKISKNCFNPITSSTCSTAACGLSSLKCSRAEASSLVLIARKVGLPPLLPWME